MMYRKSDKTSNPIVVNFHDSLLRQSDLDELGRSCWLTDSVITFAFEYFSHQQYSVLKHRVAFIGPEVTQFIKCYEHRAELDVFLEPLKLERRDYVFLAINDNISVTSAGGTHWSLLLFDRSQALVKHYDSFGDVNRVAAQQVMRKITPYLRCNGVRFEHERDAPRQQNAFDCGMYVISIAEALCEDVLYRTKTDLLKRVNSEFVSQKRREWYRLGLSMSSTSF